MLTGNNYSTHDLLCQADSVPVDDVSADLVERDDGGALLQLAALQQQLARHLRVHHHVVQLQQDSHCSCVQLNRMVVVV